MTINVHFRSDPETRDNNLTTALWVFCDATLWPLKTSVKAGQAHAAHSDRRASKNPR
jgi:hypothetical protein